MNYEIKRVLQVVFCIELFHSKLCIQNFRQLKFHSFFLGQSSCQIFGKGLQSKTLRAGVFCYKNFPMMINKFFIIEIDIIDGFQITISDRLCFSCILFTYQSVTLQHSPFNPSSQIWKEHFLLHIIIQQLPSSQIHDQ